MGEEDRRLLGEIREALVQMPNNPEGIAGWLLSNYNLNKVDNETPAPARFYSPTLDEGPESKPRHPVAAARRQDKQVESANVLAKDDTTPSTTYFSRTGVKGKTASEIKSLAEKIKSNSASVPENWAALAWEQEEQLPEEYSEEPAEEEDPIFKMLGEKQKAAQSELRRSGAVGNIRRSGG